ncbi:Fumarylacetoacetate hydrolase family protein [Conexivisphaera calida]|uniref:Fumarylacetoacetate hydrolase family protein n=1 Tax=Conexivisphaera calida TaxID=1874277 RepID=A0A4V0P1N7_9ARCH|nr:Fumarylacetoacetate hydrolase family protein [Conexivisphaera calida]
MTYRNPYTMEDRSGLLHADQVVDLNSSYAAILYREGITEGAYRIADGLLPTSTIDVLRGGRRSLDAAREVLEFASKMIDTGKTIEGPRGERASFRAGEVKLRAPLRPGKIIHTAGNFREHAKEAQKAGWEFPIPQWISFLKNPDAVVGPEDPVIYPSYTKELDYELEMGIIIGKKCKEVTPEEAVDCIVGYTVFNDITARDIQRMEMKNGLLNLGKNMDTFAILGPCIALRDEVPDPHNLKMEFRVNGEPRQQSGTWNLSVKVPEIVSRYSVVTLYPGDMISTGTVSGVAAFREDPFKYYLKPGDVIESEIERIGVVRNTVVAGPPGRIKPPVSESQ